MKKNEAHPVQTTLTITVGFLIIFWITKLQWSLSVAIVIGLMGVLSTYLAQKIHFLWMKLTWILSLIVPNILLSVVFFGVLFPIAWLSRLGGKDPLRLKNKERSLFKMVDRKYDKPSLEKPW